MVLEAIPIPNHPAKKERRAWGRNHTRRYDQGSDYCHVLRSEPNYDNRMYATNPIIQSSLFEKHLGLTARIVYVSTYQTDDHDF